MAQKLISIHIKDEKTLQYIFKQIGYETLYLSDNLSRTELTPWNFDFYEFLKTESIINKVIKDIELKKQKPSFYFLSLIICTIRFVHTQAKLIQGNTLIIA